jgi:hypothetical protein
MANQLGKAISIKDARQKIDSGKLLLPAIQRRFVWNTYQIEMLFDSPIQGYPINTFMFWEVSDPQIKNEFRFYDFLRKYVEHEGGNNPLKNTVGYEDFYAVIDGQQRLNSFYIGLNGTFAEKKYSYRKKKYQEDDIDFPPKKLYLDLLSLLEDDSEKKKYDFRFLEAIVHRSEFLETQKEIGEDDHIHKIDCHWFEVGKILTFVESSEELVFPLKSMKEKIVNINRNFTLSEESLEGILRTPYDNLDSFYILALLFPNFNYTFKNPIVDHLHPRAAFENQTFDCLENNEVKIFYKDHWNTVLNLALLSEENNKSKGKGALKPWVDKQDKYRSNLYNELLIPSDVDLDFHNFKQFIQEREILLKKRILENI